MDFGRVILDDAHVRQLNSLILSLQMLRLCLEKLLIPGKERHSIDALLFLQGGQIADLRGENMRPALGEFPEFGLSKTARIMATSRAVLAGARHPKRL